MSEKAGLVEELHKGVRKNFPRRYVTIKGLHDLYQADLVEMIPYSDENDDYKYLLTIIDTFSKRAWAFPLKSKKGAEIAKTLELMFSGMQKTPKFLQVDQGTEFYNKIVTKVLDRFKIHLYSSFSIKKASIIERFNRTLKSWMWKEFSLRGSYEWVTLIEGLLKKYNNRVHRTIGMAPAKVNYKNEKRVLKRIVAAKKLPLKKKNKFKVGDYVRISKYKHIFEKGYTPNFTTEVFTIHEVQKTRPVTYKLKDLEGELIQGGFYEQELQKTKYKNTYLVEKIIKKKGKKILVKWLGFDDKFNQWIDSSDVIE